MIKRLATLLRPFTGSGRFIFVEHSYKVAQWLGGSCHLVIAIIDRPLDLGFRPDVHALEAPLLAERFQAIKNGSSANR